MTARIRLKIAVLAPMPRPSDSAMTIARPGLRPMLRMVKRRSLKNPSMRPPLTSELRCVARVNGERRALRIHALRDAVAPWNFHRPVQDLAAAGLDALRRGVGAVDTDVLQPVGRR